MMSNSNNDSDAALFFMGVLCIFAMVAAFSAWLGVDLKTGFEMLAIFVCLAGALVALKWQDMIEVSTPILVGFAFAFLFVTFWPALNYWESKEFFIFAGGHGAVSDDWVWWNAWFFKAPLFLALMSSGFIWNRFVREDSSW